MRVPRRIADRLIAAKRVLDHATRINQITPKALRVMRAIQSGEVSAPEAYDELEESLDTFIERYID